MASSDEYGKAESKQRLQKLLRGGFSGSPTPLKDIPKKGGESRAQTARNKAGARSKKAKAK